MNSKVQVDVLGAKDLIPKALNRLSNPYCIIGLANNDNRGFEGETVRSKILFLTLKPKWKNVTFTTEKENPTIRVEIWHKDHNSTQDAFEGYAIVPVDFSQKKERDLWIPLKPQNAEDRVGGSVWVLVTVLASSKIHPSVVQNREQRMVRVFLSSTFRDMQAEREEIVRKVLVELDKYCYDRGCSLTYIDMRWGITDEMGKNMQTIVSCLREVDNSRPYFLGTIAERYGWHQEKDGDDQVLTKTFEAAEEFPEFAWIKKYRDRSVTELEIRHGYLLNGCLPEGHVFFYFRDRAYLNNIPASQISDHVEKSPYAIQRLKDLKEEIAENHKKGTCALAEYKDAEHLGKMVLEDLKKAVDRDFPMEHEAWGKLHIIRTEHENYGRQLCVSYVPRTYYLNELDKFLDPDLLSVSQEIKFTQGVTNSQELARVQLSHQEAKKETKGKLMIIFGQSGSGKSSLTANWWLTLSKSRQQSSTDEKPLFVHFVGASALASSFMLMIIRLFEEINTLLGPENEIPIPKEEGLVDAIPRFLEAISTKGGMIIVFDAVNQLPEKYHNLHWIPHSLPPQIHIVISMIPTDAIETAIQEKKEKAGDKTGEYIRMMHVQPLTAEEGQQLVECKLALFGKKLAPENMQKLISHECSGNPLFLTTVINELCIIGHYAAFQNQLNIFLSSTSMPNLFQKVLERWETLCDPELVKSILCLILGSRYGATEKAILIITEASPAVVSPLMSAMKRMLIVYMANLNFSHPYLRQAVELKYPPEAVIEMQYKLATYLRMFTFDEHVANELPWLLMRIIQSPHCADSAHAQTELSEVLLDFSHFSVIGKNDSLKYELINHWANLKQKDPKWNLGPLYSERALRYIAQVNERIASAEPENIPTIKYEAAAILLTVSQTLRLSSAQADARTIGAHALSVFLQVPTYDPISDEPLDIDQVLLDEDHLNKASKYHELFAANSALFAHPHLTSFISNLGDILRNLGKLEQSGGCYKRTLIIRTEQFGDNHPDVATALNLVGNIARETGKLDEASDYYKRSLSIREALFGENNLVVAALLNDLGILQCNQKKLEEGKATHLRALAIRTALLGARHPNVANSWNNLGTIYRDQGDFEEGLRCYNNALSIRREQFGEFHPHVGFSLNNLGILLMQKGELEEAAAVHRQALKIRTELFGEKHPDVVVSLNNLGAVLKKQGKEEEANEILEKAKAIKASL